MRAINPSTWETEAGGFLSLRPAWSTEPVPGQPRLQGYREIPCLQIQIQMDQGPPHKVRHSEANRKETGEDP